jgi:Fe-S-cluster containining protein
LKIKDKLKPLFDKTQSKKIKKWFEPPEEDEDFESGVAVGTEVINGKCTFLDKDGLCTLQKLANNEGEFKWKYKPLYCILFPLTVYDGVLTIDDEHIERLDSCNVNPSLTIFEAVEEELKYFLGEDGYAELEEYREEYLTEHQAGDKKNASK